MNVHVLKTFVIFVGYKVLYFPQENDILYQPCLEIFVGYEVLYFPQENDILHQPRLVFHKDLFRFVNLVYTLSINSEF